MGQKEAGSAQFGGKLLPVQNPGFWATLMQKACWNESTNPWLCPQGQLPHPADDYYQKPGPTPHPYGHVNTSNQ